jgi:hypothetical protein
MFTIRRTVTTLAGMFVALATFIGLGPAAYAQPAPLPDDTYLAPTTSTVSTVSNGSPLWVFAVVAIAAAIVTLAAAMTAAKLRHSAHPRAAFA